MYNSRMPCFAMHVKCWHTGSVRSRFDIPWLEYRILIKYCAYVFSVVSKIVNFCTSSRIIRPPLYIRDGAMRAPINVHEQAISSYIYKYWE